jgi:hypothetical protein
MVVVIIAGCGGKTSNSAPEARENLQLKEIYELYSMAMKKNQKPPNQLSDFKEFSAIHATAMQSLRSGQFIVVWGTSTGKGDQSVLAYEKDAPQNGGPVLLADGTIKNMSGSDLQAAIKPKG